MADEILTRRLMDQVSEELLRPYRTPISSIYIDADLLYDYRLGALMLTIQSDEQYAYVRHHIPDYEKGTYPRITKYFPALPVEESDLDKLEQDPNMDILIHATAPKTKLLDDLGNFITKVNTFNISKDLSHPLRININQRRTTIPYKIWVDLVRYITERCGKVEVTRTNYHNWGEVPEKEILDGSMFFVYDLKNFLETGTTSQKLLKDSKCLDKIVLSPYQTDNEFSNPKEEKTALDNLEAIMSLFVSEFSFYKKSIPMEG